MLIHRRQSQAWHAGLLVYLALVLTSSLFAAPWVAAELDFGHRHPDDQPSHVHEISGVITGALTAVMVAVAVTRFAVMLVAPRSVDTYCESVLCLDRPIRAPPAGT